MGGSSVKSKAGPPAPPPDIGPVEVPVTQSDLDAYEQLTRIRAELGDDEGKVVLKRRNAKGQLGALGVIAAVDFSIERVISDWGGGRYVAVFYHGNGEKLDTMNFDVDDSIPQRVPRAVLEEIKETTTAPAPEQPRTYVPIQDNGRVEALERSLASTNDLLKTLIMASLNRPPAESSLDVAIKLAEIMKGPPPERMGVTDMKDLFIAGLEAKAAADGDEGYLPVLKTFADPLAKIVTHALGSGKEPRVAGALPPGTPAPTPVTLPPGQSWLVHLQPHLRTLLAWAQAGKNPELYAEVILDNLTPGAQMEIAQAAQDPEFVSKTLAALPMFAPYSAWATAVLVNIKELVTAEEPEPSKEEEADPPTS